MLPTLRPTGLMKRFNRWLDEPPSRSRASNAEYVAVLVTVVMIILKFGSAGHDPHSSSRNSARGRDCYHTVDKFLLSSSGKKMSTRYALWQGSSHHIDFNGLAHPERLKLAKGLDSDWRSPASLKLTLDHRVELETKGNGRRMLFECDGCGVGAEPIEVEVLVGQECTESYMEAPAVD